MPLPSTSPGEIIADAVYSIDEFKRRTGLQNKALRINRAKGLRVFQCGNRRFVYGRDWIGSCWTLIQDASDDIVLPNRAAEGLNIASRHVPGREP